MPVISPSEIRSVIRLSWFGPMIVKTAPIMENTNAMIIGSRNFEE